MYYGEGKGVQFVDYLVSYTATSTHVGPVSLRDRRSEFVELITLEVFVEVRRIYTTIHLALTLGMADHISPARIQAWYWENCELSAYTGVLDALQV